MKRQIFLIVIFMSVFFIVKGQGTMLRGYEYDAAGNRIIRSVLIIPAPQQKSMDWQSETEELDELEDIGELEEFYVDKVGNISLKIFPNPTTSIVRFEIMNGLDEVDGTVTLYNLSGAKTGEQRITSYRTEIDMSSYPAATYLATIRINGKASYWKIIKN